MCTAITYKTKDHYFGRNLDLEYSYKETVTVTPRNYVFDFRKMGKLESHFAMVGMAYIADGYPLYYDATNEKGLSAAGLNFPENADYKAYCDGKENVAPFELIPILRSVEMQRGCVLLGNGLYEITVYSSCCNTDRGIYYYTTYDNSRIHAVDMHRENLQGSELIAYPLKKDLEIAYQN